MPKVKTIEPKRFYTLAEIQRDGLLNDVIPTSERRQIRAFIQRGMIKANTYGDGRGARYFIKGEWLITFIAKWEDGDFHAGKRPRK